MGDSLSNHPSGDCHVAIAPRNDMVSVGACTGRYQAMVVTCRGRQRCRPLQGTIVIVHFYQQHSQNRPRQQKSCRK